MAMRFTHSELAMLWWKPGPQLSARADKHGRAVAHAARTQMHNSAVGGMVR